MRLTFALTCVLMWASRGLGQEELPIPRPFQPPRTAPLETERSWPPRSGDLEQNVLQLIQERAALAAAQSSTAQERSQVGNVNTASNLALKMRLKLLLARLKQVQEDDVPPPRIAPPRQTSPYDLAAPPAPKTAAGAEAPKLERLPPLLPPAPSSDSARTPVDSLAVALALFRAGSYEPALQAFRLVNLKGMRADQRAPVQYLMASCLRKLDKLDDAVALYREVANAKGDEEVAACAQWQLANLRWQREMRDRLNEMKQRRLAVEKQP